MRSDSNGLLFLNLSILQNLSLSHGRWLAILLFGVYNYTLCKGEDYWAWGVKNRKGLKQYVMRQPRIEYDH